MKLNEMDKSLADYDEACRLRPGSAAWRNNRAELRMARKEWDKAIDEFTDVLKTSPEFYFALFNRGECYLAVKEYAKAKEDFEAILKNESNVPALHDNLAKIFASAPDEKLRDGKKAVESANTACEQSGWRNGRFIETLAAAHAEAGDFAAAVKWQLRAFHDNECLKERGDDMRVRLNLYRDKKPLRLEK